MVKLNPIEDFEMEKVFSLLFLIIGINCLINAMYAIQEAHVLIAMLTGAALLIGGILMVFLGIVFFYQDTQTDAA